MHFIAYNCTRRLMCEAARNQGVPVRRSPEGEIRIQTLKIARFVASRTTLTGCKARLKTCKPTYRSSNIPALQSLT